MSSWEHKSNKKQTVTEGKMHALRGSEHQRVGSKGGKKNSSGFRDQERYQRKRCMSDGL